MTEDEVRAILAQAVKEGIINFMYNQQGKKLYYLKQVFITNIGRVIMDYQEFVKSTDISNCNLQFYVDGMTEESGEISGIFKRVRRGDYGEQAKEDIDELGLRYVLSTYDDVRQDMLKELGDIHWYTSRFIQEIGSTWGEVEAINTEKLMKRKIDGKIMGHGDNR